MDNFVSEKRRVVLVKKSFNPATGESVVRTRPRIARRQRTVVARGYRSSSYDGEGHTVGDVLMAKATPFRFAMTTLLRRAGYATDGMPFKTVLIKFYNLFSGHPQEDETVFINNVVFKLKTNDDPTGDVDSARNQNSFVVVANIVNEVINIFKRSRDKYDTCIANGLVPEQLLTDAEVTEACATRMVERSLMRESKRDHYVSSGEFKKTLRWLLGIGIVVFIISKL